MTDEERALAVVGDLDQDWLDDPVAKVAAAIRAAEDEALERAASRLMSLIEACEGCEGDPNHPCPMCVAQDEAIDVIRSLKSGGAA